MEIIKLDDYRETQLNPKVLQKIQGREWYCEDYWGRRLYGGWSREDLEKVCKIKQNVIY